MDMTNPSDDLDFGQTIRGFTEEQKVFGRFTLLRVIGRGGMGVVWLARDQTLEEDVALKFMPETVRLDDVAIQDLKRETRKSRQLTHPHIVRIHDFFEDNQTAAIAMEYVDGATLSSLRMQQSGHIFEPDQLEDWLRQLGYALGYAHEQERIVHRDLKPSNLMVNSRGQIKITDFGISSSITDSMSQISMRHGVSGSPPYMSPQQLQGTAPQPSDDIYSFGATIYELVAGKPPFYRGNITHQILEVVPESMANRRRELIVPGQARLKPIPEQWETVIAQCLSKDPAVRPGSVMSVVDGLFGSAGTATRVAVKPGAPSSHRKKVLLLLGIGVAVAALFGILWIAAPELPIFRSKGKTPAAPEAGVPKVVAAVPEPPVPPEPSPIPEIAAPPAPSRSDLFQRDFSDARQIEARGGHVEAIKALAKLSAEYPEFGDAIHTEMGTPVRHLFEGKGVLDAAELTQLEAPLDAAAKRGTLSAQMLLGASLLPSEPDKALSYYRLAADNGNPKAALVTGDLLAKIGSGSGVPDFIGAVSYYQRAANVGDDEAIDRLGECYELGKGVSQEPARAVKLYQEAARKGNTRALNRMGDFFRKGFSDPVSGISVDYAKAFACFSEAMAAGDPEAPGNIGVMYANGEIIDGKAVTGKPQRDRADNKMAFQMFTEGKRRGNARALYYYGLFLHEGWGTLPDVEAGIAAITEAASRLEPDSEAEKWLKKNGDPGPAPASE